MAGSVAPRVVSAVGECAEAVTGCEGHRESMQTPFILRGLLQTVLEGVHLLRELVSVGSGIRPYLG
jgi:hypothetical protein